MSMLEGGNGQWKGFREKQKVEGEIEEVYRTKAGRYYRER